MVLLGYCAPSLGIRCQMFRDSAVASSPRKYVPQTILKLFVNLAITYPRPKHVVLLNNIEFRCV